MNPHDHNVSILLHLLYYAPELTDLWAGSRLAASFDRRLEEGIRLSELEPKAEQKLDAQVEDLEELLESVRSERLTAILGEARDGGRPLPPRVSWMAWSARTGVSAQFRLKRLNWLRQLAAQETGEIQRSPTRGPSTRGESWVREEIPRRPLDLSLNLPADSPRSPKDPREPAERSINIWLAEAPERESSTLSAGKTSLLHFNVGEAVDGSLVAGQDVEVKDADVPDKGLETRWLLHSSTLDLAAEPEDLATTVSAAAGDIQEARFTLRIPKQGESEVRRLRIAPRPGAEAPSLDVTIFVGAEVYRRLAVTFRIEGDAAAVLERDETLYTPLRHAGLRPSHEWTTPPGTLTIAVLGGQAVVRGSLGGSRQVEGIARWFGVDGQIAGRINSLRAAAEKFRIKHEAYLNAIDPGDLIGRLGSFRPQYAWGALSFEADPAHEAAWDAVSLSAELHNLAVFGHLLYKAFFPDGGDLRQWLDGLAPGHRVDLSWLRDGTSGWMPHVPWGLMYREPPPPLGTAVDPMNFLGLRFRIAHSSHPQQGTKALGGLADFPHAHLLFWGNESPTGAESRWQRALWQSVGRPVLLPSGAPEPKGELLKFLDPPAGKGSPFSMLYFFCHYRVNDGSEPELRFGDTGRAPEVIPLSELGLSPLLGQPLVFANACSTTAADPYFANELATRFIERGCRAFIGTETKVPIELASRFAATFTQFFFRQVDPEPIAAGEAMAQSRLFLWTRYRNLGGLFYTYVNRFELFLASDAEVAALKN